MNTTDLHRMGAVAEFKYKMRFAMLWLPLFGGVGGVLKALGLPSDVSLMILIPVFALVFAHTFLKRADRPEQHGN